MPAISRFLGIIIYMYTEVHEAHQLPHFHTKYGSDWASFSIDPPVLLAGALPRPQLRYVLAWAELHIDELAENWRLVQAGEPPMKIEGL